MVSLLAFYSYNPSSNPAEAYLQFFSMKCWERNKISKKEAGIGWPIKNSFLGRPP